MKSKLYQGLSHIILITILAIGIYMVYTYQGTALPPTLSGVVFILFVVNEALKCPCCLGRFDSKK